MVPLLSISGLSYFENPRNTHNQREESRKVGGQYFHEHGNVIQNICKKSEETKRKAKNTSNWTNSYKQAAAPSYKPPLFSLRVKFRPGNNNKTSSVGLISEHLFAILQKHIYPFLHAKRILPHMPVPSAGENYTSHTPFRQRHTANIQSLCWSYHLLVTTSWWLQLPLPPGSPRQHLWGTPEWLKSPTESWKRPERRVEEERVSIWWVTVSKLAHLTWTVSQNW